MNGRSVASTGDSVRRLCMNAVDEKDVLGVQLEPNSLDPSFLRPPLLNTIRHSHLSPLSTLLFIPAGYHLQCCPASTIQDPISLY